MHVVKFDDNDTMRKQWLVINWMHGSCLFALKRKKQRREMNADQFSLKVLGNSSKFTWSLYQLFPPFPEYTIFSGGAEIPPKCAKVLWTKSGKRGKIDPFSCSKSEMTFLEDRSSERQEVTDLKIELRTVIRSVWLLFYSLNNVYKHTCVHTSYLSFLLHRQDFWIPNCTMYTPNNKIHPKISTRKPQ